MRHVGYVGFAGSTVRAYARARYVSFGQPYISYIDTPHELRLELREHFERSYPKR